MAFIDVSFTTFGRAPIAFTFKFYNSPSLIKSNQKFKDSGDSYTAVFQ
jgi:hypothetical protein